MKISGPIEARRLDGLAIQLCLFPLMKISGPIEARCTPGIVCLRPQFPLMKISGPIEAQFARMVLKITGDFR